MRDWVGLLSKSEWLLDCALDFISQNNLQEKFNNKCRRWCQDVGVKDTENLY